MTFYKYVRIADPALLRAEHLKDAEELGIKGRILISPEGINGAACGLAENSERYMQYLRSFEEFKDMTFRVQECEENVFTKLHVREKQEVVNSGLADRPEVDPVRDTGTHIKPEAFRKLKDRDDVVILDVRSNYEHKVGRFRNAVTLDIENFREFPGKVKELEAYKDKKIITYCTGGVKCEKASAFLKQKGFEDVHQLEGGIIQYAKDTGGEDFDGRCYVFDRRVTVDVNRINPRIVSRCIHCNDRCARIINCVNPECNEQVVICSSCGFEWEGACSELCRREGTPKRAFNPRGYYEKSQ